jgi:hypothetical protein
MLDICTSVSFFTMSRTAISMAAYVPVRPEQLGKLSRADMVKCQQEPTDSSAAVDNDGALLGGCQFVHVCAKMTEVVGIQWHIVVGPAIVEQMHDL